MSSTWYDEDYPEDWYFQLPLQDPMWAGLAELLYAARPERRPVEANAETGVESGSMARGNVIGKNGSKVVKRKKKGSKGGQLTKKPAKSHEAGTTTLLDKWVMGGQEDAAAKLTSLKPKLVTKTTKFSAGATASPHLEKGSDEITEDGPAGVAFEYPTGPEDAAESAGADGRAAAAAKPTVPRGLDW